MITTKLVPIYTENIKGRQNHTIFIDKQTNVTYKAYHKEPSQAMYWFGFFIVLAVLRGIQEVSIPTSSPVAFLIIISLFMLVFISVKLFYKKIVYEEVKEIHLTESMIEDYIERGKKGLQLEIWVAVISLIVVLLLALLFFVTYNIVLLIFMFFTFIFFTVYLFRLPVERFKLYKE